MFPVLRDLAVCSMLRVLRLRDYRVYQRSITSAVSVSRDDRAIGCLYGQAIGDALGSRYEFANAESVQKMMVNDVRPDGFLPILGGGPFNLVAGQVTDDTELAAGLARSLLKSQTLIKEDVASQYLKWRATPPFDIGSATDSALLSNQRPNSANLYEMVVQNSLTYNTESLSNGCLMRISPLAIASTDWSEESVKATANSETRMTNPNPIAIDAVFAYVTAIRHLIITGDRNKAHQAATRAASLNITRELLEVARKKPVPVEFERNGKVIQTNGDSYLGNVGYLGVALQGAFYELLNSDSFEQALVHTVRRGGDTDTNGCITGALVGAYFGAAAIPQEWKHRVKSRNSDSTLT